MHEVLAQVYAYMWGAWRHRWLGLALAWVVAIGGWVWVWQLPESYVASARVYVDTNSVLRPLLRGLTVQPNISQRISMLSRTLLSRPNLEKLMRMTDLDLLVNTDAEREEMMGDLRQSISLSGNRSNASLYSIRVRNEDRDMAKRITQALITVFVESSLSGKREDSSGAQDFLDDQIVEYEQRLIDAENRLAVFKQTNVAVLPGGGGGYYARLERARLNLSEARLQLDELEQRRSELQRQIDGEDPAFISSSVIASGRASPLDARIQSMRLKLDVLLTKYTEKHPEVRQLRELIAELEAEKQSQYQLVREEPNMGFPGFSDSPVYQGMRSMLAETEANVAELRVRVEEYERRVSDLEAKVHNIPEIEAELKQLDRDYSVIAGQHQELLERRESARLSQDVEQTASDVTFRVIDPPFVPLEPSEPDKLSLNAVMLLLGVAVGAGVSLVVSLLYPVISDPRTLVNVAGAPLLGLVTLNMLPAQKRRETYGLVAFASLSICLVVICVALGLGQSGLLPS